MESKKTSDLLENLWEEFVLSKDSIAEEPALLNAEALLAIAEKKESSRGRRVATIAKWTWRGVALAAACISIIAILYCRHNAVETVLVSSDISKAHYVLPDGSNVWLNKGSRLSYKGNLDGRNRDVRLQGEGYFDVAKNPSKPFRVITDQMSVTALGTKFSVVAYDNGATQTFLEAGKTLVEASNGETCVLSPGQSACLDSSNGAFTVTEENVNNHLSWTKDRMVFYNVPLTDIIESLRHWYNVDIEYNSEELRNAGSFTLTVRDEPISDILDAISHMESISYSINTEKITIQCR